MNSNVDIPELDIFWVSSRFNFPSGDPAILSPKLTFLRTSSSPEPIDDTLQPRIARLQAERLHRRWLFVQRELIAFQSCGGVAIQHFENFPFSGDDEGQAGLGLGLAAFGVLQLLGVLLRCMCWWGGVWLSFSAFLTILQWREIENWNCRALVERLWMSGVEAIYGLLCSEHLNSSCLRVLKEVKNMTNKIGTVLDIDETIMRTSIF